MSGYAFPRSVGRRSSGTAQSAASSALDRGSSKGRYPGIDAVKPASRVPIVLHWPVIENGAAPGRPMLPVRSASELSRVTVSVPCTEWFTPIVQARTQRSARPIVRAVAAQHIGVDAALRGRPFHGPGFEVGEQLVETVDMAAHFVDVDEALGHDDVHDPVEERDVTTWTHRKMGVRDHRRLRDAGRRR